MLEVPTFTSHGHQELFQFISGSDSSPVPWCPPPSDTETRVTQCLLALSSVTTQLTEALSAHQKTPQGARQEPWSPGEGSKQNTIAKLSLWNLSPQRRPDPQHCLSRMTTTTEYWNWILSYLDVQNAAASASHTPTRKATS